MNIEELGFKPEVYSPYFKLVDQDLVDYCKLKKIQLTPWTVNKVKDMETMIEYGVDGIITDYPDVLKRILKERGVSVK